MNRDGYGLPQAIRSEVTKLVTLRSSLWTLLIALGGTLGIAALAANSDTHKSAQFYQHFDPTNQSLGGLYLATLAIGVFGILAFTGEYGSGTVRPSLAAIPRRGVFLLAKAIVVGVSALLLGELLSFLSFDLGQAILSSGGAPTASLAHSGVLLAVVLSGAVIGLFGLLGFGLGVLIRHTAGAISAYVGVTFLLPLVLQSLGGHVVRYTPLGILANSVSAVVRNPVELAPVAGFLVIVLYCAAAVAAGSVLMVRRDA
jgi:ABC-2 type transport system permease protein